MADDTTPGSDPPAYPRAGDQLGPYRIESIVGEGGMGRVYKARDTRLDRTIALKVCHADFNSRFDREARAIAALNHPHICTLHDLGPNYLVMEFVEGETLAARLRKQPVVPDDVIRFGAQIADALAAAHACDIVHRDLKPGNIMLTRTGAKVLDFGVAKIATDRDATRTVSGGVIGTPAYMAPEQLEGRCDARTDIYALGLVLYEMATGRRPRAGEARALQELPLHLAHVIDRCLEQDPASRWQAASDVKYELEWAAKRGAVADPVRHRRSNANRAASVSAVCLLLLFGWWMVNRGPRTTELRALRLTIDAPPGTDFGVGPAISPDARQIAFVLQSGGISRLSLRPLDSLTPRDIPGTNGATYPFWSPDSRSIGFFAAGRLKRVDIRTNSVNDICGVGQGRGGTWNSDGTILFNSVNDGPLFRVQASGGQPQTITRVETARGENSHRWPFFLPGGRKFLYFIRADTPEVEGIYIGSLDTPNEKRLVVRSHSNGVYVPPIRTSTGYLMWGRGRSVIAQPFAADAGSVRGAPVTLTEGVSLIRAGRLAEVSIATDSTVVYRIAAEPSYQLTWYRKDGRPDGTIGLPDSYVSVSLSRDGKRIAIVRPFSVDGHGGIALIEPARGIATPFTVAFMGAWSPDGQRMAFSWSRSGAPNIYVKPASGAGEQVRVTHSAGSQSVHDWSSDGRYLAYSESSNEVPAAIPRRLWILPLDGDRKPFAHGQAHGPEVRAQFSPDAQWLAYTADQDGRPEIYVEVFPGGHGRSKISPAGGDYVRWRRDGKELYYVAPDRMLMAVPVRGNGKAAEFGTPTPLFRVSPTGADAGDYPYDTSPDGRFLVLVPGGDISRPSLAVLLNWESGLD